MPLASTFSKRSWAHRRWGCCASFSLQPRASGCWSIRAIRVSTNDVTTAARALGVQIDVVQARDSGEIELAFATLVRSPVDALLVGADSFFFNRRLQLAALATRHAIPAIYTAREFVEVGGLMAYGTNLTEVYRQLGDYTSRILKGGKPADLPVVQSTKFELVINAQIARMLGLTVPPSLLAVADEVIE